MPKSKAVEKKETKSPNKAEETEKIIEIDEEAVALDDEEDLLGSEEELGEGDDEETLDTEEVDPFNDKWEQ